MWSTLNRWVAVACVGLAFCIGVFGAYLGGFAWLNEGPAAGLRLLFGAAAFVLALIVMSRAFRLAAEAHANARGRHWWIQLGAIGVALLAYGLAAIVSALLDGAPGR